MNVVDAVNALKTVLDGSAPFNTSHALYGPVVFQLGYPTATVAIPHVAFTPIGGAAGTETGIGTYDTHDHPACQVDVLGATVVDVLRIYQRMVKAVKADYEGMLTPSAIGAGYLRDAGIRHVQFSQPSAQPWDEDGRVQRVTGTVTFSFYQEA